MTNKITENHRTRMRGKIIQGAKKYKDKLIGKDFWVICIDGSVYDVRFFSKDFIHLTGVASDLSDERFFDNSSSGTLSVGNILEEQKYNWNTLKGKTDRIENIDQIVYGNSKSSLFMVNLHTNTGNYPVAIRNKDINACIGFRDAIHRARTLRKYSNSENADRQLAILAIFAKKPEEEIYSELVYLENGELLLEKKKDILNFLTDEIGKMIKPSIDELNDKTVLEKETV